MQVTCWRHWPNRGIEKTHTDSIVLFILQEGTANCKYNYKTKVQTLDTLTDAGDRRDLTRPTEAMETPSETSGL